MMKTYKSYYIHEALDTHPHGFSKSFNFKDYTTGEGVDTTFTLSDDDIVESLYSYANYQYYDRMGKGSAILTLKQLWERFIDNHVIELSDMLSALYSKYNPLENYNKHGNIVDKHTGTDAVTGTSGNTRTLNTTDTLNGTNSSTQTLNTKDKLTGSLSSTQTLNTKDSTDYDSTHSTANTSYTDTHNNPTVETTHKESSFDSEVTRVTSVDSTNGGTNTDQYGARTSTLTNDGNDSTTHTGTVGVSGSNTDTTEHTGTVGVSGSNTDTRTNTGTITDTGTSGNTTTYNSTTTNIDTTHGNIGVMTSQSMITEEMKLRRYSFIDYVITYFIATNCYYSDGIDFTDFR